MRCVKLTLPPRERARWLLMTTRLSMSSLAGTARTLVAVGTESETSMLDTTRDGAPRRGVTTSSLTGPVPLTAGMSRGFGVSADGSDFGSLLGSVFASVFGSAFAGVPVAGADAAGGWAAAFGCAVFSGVFSGAWAAAGAGAA